MADPARLPPRFGDIVPEWIAARLHSVVGARQRTRARQRPLPPALPDQEKMLIMDRFETESMALLPGQRVRVRILSHHPWGVKAEIIGHEHVGASADLIEQSGTAVSAGELPAMFPRADAEIDAVVQQVRRRRPPAWVRLSIQPGDLESFTWPCDFCGEPVVLSAGGGGLTLDARSVDGPGSSTLISHRTCLASRLHPGSTERARIIEPGMA